ncbi:hypothetical protein KUM39_26070 [Streptomyces sp. J2-1]|uniref:hypothetical protein n=1 Tax=Streptomyces corallincola TaxID=2851888 RepID=UPI001C387AED|nr:hypothetical protein [Streptomyces corallincola]MBV2357783.1 hypothetical protein [Streptomyces corallincola]
MRVLPARRLASTTLCAALLVGLAGPAAVAADLTGDRDHAFSRALDAARPAVPGDLRERVRSLDDQDATLAPVVELLDQSLEQGRMTLAQAQQLGDAAKAALAQLGAANPALMAMPSPLPATPSESDVPSLPAAPGLPEASAMPAAPAATPAAAPAAAQLAKSGPANRDAVSDLLAQVTNTVNSLLSTLTSTLNGALSTVTGLVGQVLDLLGGVLGGAGLPSAPAAPAVPSAG